jgi:hypothetical protein
MTGEPPHLFFVSRFMDAFFKPYSVVRVRALLQTEDDYDGWQTNLRPPQIGDIGTIVDVVSPDRVVVENSSSEGTTIWLCEFCKEELEPI